MSEWYETLEGIAVRVWERLDQAAAERAQIAFATVSPTNTPEVRTVVLRECLTATKTLEIYTDLQSDKIASLRASPHASLLLWDADLALQIRAVATVTIQTGDDVMDRWRAIPDHSKLSYGITPAPGQPIHDGTAYEKAPDPSVFAVLVCQIHQIDAVYLGKIHRRAVFSRDGDWAGNWLAP